ncbi:uncharacterized protein LOC134743977 [Cydia strobilella]|uniref:uncharacterized protein LOC134743977 n=1 Tax=Cydia strobilella TaxID=1100964 RepID=UPI003007DFA7
MHNKRNKGLKARAYPVSDANASNAIPNANTTRAFPPSDGYSDKNTHSHLSSNKIRLATWNLGSLTGRSQELSKVLHKRRINICCLQETKWKGSKSKDIGNEYQLIYHGCDNKRNGVAIVLDKHFKTRILSITRKSDRLISIKLALDNQQSTNIISAYAPQTGCTEAEKTEFWEDLDEVINSIPSNEYKVIGADLNGHVGAKSTAYGMAHGGFGIGEANKQGEEILDFATRHSLTLINTNFQKKEEHLITYKSAGRTSQIDFIIADRNVKNKFKDCKVIPGEPLTTQHRLLVAVYTLPKPIKTIVDRTPRTKWKDLDGPKGELLKTYVRGYIEADVEARYNTAEDMWSKFEVQCRAKAAETLGISKGPMGNGKDPSWWNNKVKETLNNKKTLFKKWQSSQLNEDKDQYTEAKKLAKKCVAQEIAHHNLNFYNSLENAKTADEVLKIAKNRNRATLDIKVNKYIKSKDQTILTDNTQIRERWVEYYEQLLNEEFPNQDPVPCKPTHGPIPEVDIAEVKQAVTKMKNRKATGPDEIPADLWKALGPIAAVWLTKLFNIILATKCIPESWRQSYILPFYKNKGDVTHCENYRGIKLTSHTLKIWERVINKRISNISQVSPNQFGFTASRSTTDAIQTIRIMMEKYRINNQDLHLTFIDLEKAFDRVPRKLVWQALRTQQVPEYYIELIQDMYNNVSTRVRSLAGVSKAFEVKVGVHQGSVLSPLLFNLVMDYLTRDIPSPLPWTMMYADDIVLAANTANDAQQLLNMWTNALEKYGLRVSRSKTEYLKCPFSGNSTPETICIGTTPIPTVEKFKYLGSIITPDANICADVSHRINVAWQKWRSLTGVLCDPRIPIKVKGKVYKRYGGSSGVTIRV